MAKEIPLAYRLSLRDADAHFYEDAPKKIFCEECGSVLDRNYIPTTLKLHSGKLRDLGSTYDNQAIYSKRFKDHCEEAKYAVDFWTINSALLAFHFRPKQSLRFDAVRRKTKFSPCPRCNGYYEVIGATPIFLLDVATPVQRGIFRTDLEFGSFSSKGPVIVVGVETKAELARRKLTGVGFSPIFAKYVINGVIY